MFLDRTIIELRRTGISDLDEAFYLASCFAGHSPTLACTIWYQRVGDGDAYCIVDSPATPAVGEWTACYTVTRADDGQNESAKVVEFGLEPCAWNNAAGPNRIDGAVMNAAHRADQREG